MSFYRIIFLIFMLQNCSFECFTLIAFFAIEAFRNDVTRMFLTPTVSLFKFKIIYRGIKVKILNKWIIQLWKLLPQISLIINMTSEIILVLLKKISQNIFRIIVHNQIFRLYHIFCESFSFLYLTKSDENPFKGFEEIEANFKWQHEAKVY